LSARPVDAFVRSRSGHTGITLKQLSMVSVAERLLGSRPRTRFKSTPATWRPPYADQMSWDRKPDNFGVPGNMFGPISEEMFGAIGRVVAITSLVEMNAVDLITMIDRLPQTQTAGKSISAVLNQRKQAQKSALSADVVALLTEVADALDERHAVAHGLWTVSLDGSTFLWRPVVEAKRVASHIHTVGDTMTIDDMRSLIGRLVDLSARLKSRQTTVSATSTETEQTLRGS
jgi:hypothetical protein